MRKAPEPKKTATNPIEALRNETRENNLSGLIIKSGYDIDKDRGFYLVSLDGKSAIIGKSGEEIFVLKKIRQKHRQTASGKNGQPECLYG